MEYMLMQPVVTRQMVLNELIKAGINKEIADDLSYRYYKNELTYKDIEYLKENFDIKLKHLEEKIFDTKEELINRIDTKFTELDNKIEINKIELNSKLKLHNWMFGTIITLNVGIFLALISMIYSVLGK
ncbi:Bdr family repetitive protein [Borrelia crocidurae]|uniref:Bdr protein n=1 Tax=Borrelia crocidurae (strain Achema) TaxID=1155096 RepID=I0FEH8_BORCA|nr:Bdr family repetitive protein [Borrelia crocidurae]AFI31884.1 Bdr protein [Borrelia crocidurae str. Achema]